MNLLIFGFINYFVFIFLCTFIDQSFATEKLNPPVAFPIFRPPLEAVQRYKTSAEHLQRQHSSQNLNDTQIEIEEISTNFSNDNNTFVEPSLEGLLGDVEEEANEEFIEGKINKNKTIIEEQNNNTLENLGNFGKLKNEIKLRHLNNSINATNIINTPQFPVFTGLGMEIIDVSPSNDAEKENKFKEEIPPLSSSFPSSLSPPPHHQQQQQLFNNNHHKLHYYLNKNNTKLNKKYHPLKINKEQQQELPTTTTIPFIQLLPTTSKHFEENINPFILNQNLSEQKLNKTNNKQLNISENVREDFEGINLINGTTEWNNNNNENKNVKNDINNQTITNENKNIITSNTTTITSITSSEVNLTEKDLFTSPPSITTTKTLIEDFGRPNIRDELDNGFERVTMHLVAIPSTTTELVNNGSIIVEERPSQHQQQTTTQNILTFNGIPFNLPSTKPPSSKTIEQLNTNLFTTTIIPSNTLNSPPPPPSNDKNEVLIEQQHSHVEFPQINNNLGEGDELVNNQGNEKDKNENSKINGNIEREMENKENFVQEENLNKNGDIGESMKRTSKFSTSTSSSDNLRIFVLLGIITILLVTIALASIFSARYVKRSRQLHGKYQPAAYEMQTQQQQNRYQTTDFVNTQIYRQPPINNNFSSPPSNTPSIQQQITATFGKEERLI
uniref:Uncharacterized protein n=1 Tax=Meloidogyne incognita TaxID=6306 RepID=A0A914NDF6_MELIC